mmetsp:Transcript_29479/g.42056  ORF Transcript_29479/g.42056 Transcript_29479/m.42056 type:complete len:165 (+) Transcript_29479:38-532(+)
MIKIIIAIIILVLSLVVSVHEITKHSKINRFKVIGKILATASIASFPFSALCSDLDEGKTLFINSCSGCHNGGGNLFNSKKTLFKNDLMKNDYFDNQKLIQIITNGKGQMPAYGEFVSPKGNVIPAKFSISQLESLSSYVLEMSAKDWPAENKAKNNCDEYPGC